MKEIILCIITMALLTTVCIPTLTVTSNPEEHILPSEIVCFDSQQYILELTEPSGDSFYDYPVMTDPPCQLDPVNASPRPTVMDTPSEFNWMMYNGEDWTSPIQNQGSCGSCWLFAAIGCLECIINIQEGHADLDPDLSEQYVMSCLPDAGGCKGGWADRAFRYIKLTSAQGNYHNGVIPESCFPYRAIDVQGCDYLDCDNDPVLCSEKCDDWEQYLVPIVNYGYWDAHGSQTDIDAIKTQVMNDGPVATSMYATDEFKQWVNQHHGPTEYFPYTGLVQYSNHCIVIVGWKDDPSIEKGGYWICKNSWGEYPGYNGFFNIEYSSLNMNRDRVVWVEYDPASYDWPPIADTGGPYHGEVGGDITFDAQQSYDSEGTIVSYLWDFGDGTTAEGTQVSHTYDQCGIYPVTLTVTDTIGHQSSEETAALVDVWLEDDTWTYTLDTIDVSLEGETTLLTFLGSLEDIVFTVTEKTSESYTLEFNGKLTGSFDIDTEKAQFSGSFLRSTKVTGSIIFDTSTLGVTGGDARIKGSILLNVDLIPIPLVIPFDITLAIACDEIFDPLVFPLYPEKTWNVPSVTITVDGSIKSIWLRVLNIIDILTGQSIIPTEISSLLPVIDISELLEGFGLGENIQIPVISSVTCVDEEEVTVEAGTFQAFRISIPRLMEYSFALEPTSILDVSVVLEDLATPYGDLSVTMQGELTSTTHGQ